MPRPVSDLTKFIRSLATDTPVAEVIAKAREKGFETSESNVSRVRSEMAKAKIATKEAAVNTPKKSASKKSVKKTASSKSVTATKEPASPGTAKSAGVSKSDFIRMHPGLSVAELMAAGKDQGLTFTSSLVYMVRGRQDGKASPKKTTPKKPAAKEASAAPKKTATKKTVVAKKTSTASKPPAKKVPETTESKADFVRARAHLSPREIVEDAKAQRIAFDASYVYKVRGYDKATANKQARTSKKSAASAPVKVPMVTKTINPKPVPGNATRPSVTTSIEELLKAAAAELGLARAIEILQGERARVRAVLGG